MNEVYSARVYQSEAPTMGCKKKTLWLNYHPEILVA